MALLWLNSVKDNNSDAAIKAATYLIGKLNSTKQDKEKYEGYCQIFKDHEINSKFLSVRFNKWDFDLWKQSLFFHLMARQIIGNEDSEDKQLELLLKAVDRKIKKTETEKVILYTPYIIWQKGYGLCDKLSWVFCELAYQAGFETQIIYILDNPKTLSSIHVFCEIRKAHRTWIVDPLVDRILNDTSLIDLIKNKTLQDELWPQNTSYKKNIINCAMQTVSYPQDYCARNQFLYQKLNGLLENGCPRFGEDPISRQKNYIDLMKKFTPSSNVELQLMLWPVPIKVLARDMNPNLR